MSLEPVATDVAELNQKFSRHEIVAMVRQRNPAAAFAARSPFLFFTQTYEQMYGPGKCKETQARIMLDYIALCGTGDLPLYFVRCLLPGYRGSA